jgi:hypothetical protein
MTQTLYKNYEKFPLVLIAPEVDQLRPKYVAL